jgi:hypothetical protein
MGFPRPLLDSIPLYASFNASIRVQALDGQPTSGCALLCRQAGDGGGERLGRGLGNSRGQRKLASGICTAKRRRRAGSNRLLAVSSEAMLCSRSKRLLAVNGGGQTRVGALRKAAALVVAADAGRQNLQVTCARKQPVLTTTELNIPLYSTGIANLC